jgi:hypothetical protein
VHKFGIAFRLLVFAAYFAAVFAVIMWSLEQPRAYLLSIGSSPALTAQQEEEYEKLPEYQNIKTRSTRLASITLIGGAILAVAASNAFDWLTRRRNA